MTVWGPILAGTAILGFAACGPAVPVDPPVCSSAAAPQPKMPGEGMLLSQCGPTLDFTPINDYHGELADAVQSNEGAVVLMDGRCTGTLIQAGAGPVVLTAGHCARVGDRPVLSFNFEDNPDGDTLITAGTVFEQALEPDYALIQLDVLPAVTPVLLTVRTSDLLAIIQHPMGRPKVIAVGNFLGSCNQHLYYGDLDTLVGSSGAGVLNRQGHLLGVHTDGTCDKTGHGFNSGWTAAAIVEASPYLESTDLSDL